VLEFWIPDVPLNEERLPSPPLWLRRAVAFSWPWPRVSLLSYVTSDIGATPSASMAILTAPLEDGRISLVNVTSPEVGAGAWRLSPRFAARSAAAAG